jgi:hypothetical protein
LGVTGELKKVFKESGAENLRPDNWRYPFFSLSLGVISRMIEFHLNWKNHAWSHIQPTKMMINIPGTLKSIHVAKFNCVDSYNLMRSQKI